MRGKDVLPFLPERSRLGLGLGDIAVEGQNARGGAFHFNRAVLRRHGIEIGQAQAIDQLPEAVLAGACPPARRRRRYLQAGSENSGGSSTRFSVRWSI